MEKTVKVLFAALICLPGIACAQSEADLRYQVDYGDSNIVHVRLLYSPIQEDSTSFTYGEPRFGGQADIFEGIKNVRVSSQGSLRIDTASRTIAVHYPGKKTVVLDYDVQETHTKGQGFKGELFRPMIRNDYFYCHGVNLFLAPVLKNPDRAATQSLSWTKLPPFPLFYPFDPGNRGEKSSAGRVSSFMFSPITGSHDLTVEEVRVGSSTNYLVLRLNRQNAFNREIIVDYFKRYFSVIRRFWNDDDTGHFSLILHPFLDVDHNIGGVAFSNGFLSKYLHRTDTILTADRIFNLSHETGHHWIGGGFLSMGTENQWFDEGFNDYVTYYALVASQYLKPPAFESGLNDIFKKHYSSAVNRTPNDSVFLNYWKMGDYNKLPYWRGCIFAFYLDNQIGLTSGGRKGIRDLMLSLASFCKGKKDDYEMTVADFIKVASAYLPGDKVRSSIETFIISGDPIKFTKEMLLPQYDIIWKDGVPVLTITDTAKFIARFSVD